MIIDRHSHQSMASSARRLPISGLVLHTGEGTRSSDLAELTGPNVSAHYYVCLDGTVYELLDPARVAWHAGESRYLGRTNWNAFALGIESEHRKGQDWPVVQRKAYGLLAMVLVRQHAIRQAFVAAHRWLAPDRRSDPTDWPDSELECWIHGLYCSSVTLSRRRIAVEVANIRSQPALTAPVVGQARQGDDAVLDGSSQGDEVGGNALWYHLADSSGFMHASLF